MKTHNSNYNIRMNIGDLKKLSKSELIRLVLKLESNVPKQRVKPIEQRKPVPKPRKSVKQMVQEYEGNTILPPPQFRDKPIPAPRTKIEQAKISFKRLCKII